MREEQAIFNLKIKKKSGLSINPDIHHSKVFSSGQLHRLFSLMLYHARLYIRALYSYIYIYVAIARVGHVPTLFSRFVNS